MKGFYNKLLRVNLTTKTFSYEHISDSILAQTLGGKGLGTWLLIKENPWMVDPLSPENVFIITTGPVTQTKLWGHARFGTYTKSPATCGFGESYCGGTLAEKIKGCGVDAIIITGKADSLIYLKISTKGIAFNDAEEIKGADTYKTGEYILANSPPGSGAFFIGPAGENGVVFACVRTDDGRYLGRGGMGAVLGAKNLKGISFFPGKSCEIADPDLLKSINKKIVKLGKNSQITKNYQKLGTPNQVKTTNAHKCFPTRYWQSGYFPEWEKISADYMLEHFEVESHACPSCFMQCEKRTKIKQGRHKGLELRGPEFETIYAIGGLNEITCLEEIAWLSVVCDKLGIDTISAGNISAFAVEAYKAHKIDYEIHYGEPDRIADLYQMISYRKGIGDIFARGIKEASLELDLADMAIHVKGLEPAGFDPRVLKGMGLAYATSARGACHLRGTFYKAELSGEIDKNQISGKAKLFIDYEDRAAIFDSLILCRFFRDFIFWDELREIAQATCGMKFTKNELVDLANNITNATREYNQKEGLASSTDTLPKPLLTQANEQGATLTRQELNVMIEEYNQIRARKV